MDLQCPVDKNSKTRLSFRPGYEPSRCTVLSLKGILISTAVKFIVIFCPLA
jgi:hypothetical protein